MGTLRLRVKTSCSCSPETKKDVQFKVGLLHLGMRFVQVPFLVVKECSSLGDGNAAGVGWHTRLRQNMIVDRCNLQRT